MSLQLFPCFVISIIILTEFGVVCFACKIISGKSGLKYLFCGLTFACAISPDMIVSSGCSSWGFKSFLGEEVGELAGKVKDSLCVVRDKCHLHYAVTSPHLCMHLP